MKTFVSGRKAKRVTYSMAVRANIFENKQKLQNTMCLWIRRSYDYEIEKSVLAV